MILEREVFFVYMRCLCAVGGCAKRHDASSVLELSVYRVEIDTGSRKLIVLYSAP